VAENYFLSKETKERLQHEQQELLKLEQEAIEQYKKQQSSKTSSSTKTESVQITSSQVTTSSEVRKEVPAKVVSPPPPPQAKVKEVTPVKVATPPPPPKEITPVKVATPPPQPKVVTSPVKEIAPPPQPGPTFPENSAQEFPSGAPASSGQIDLDAMNTCMSQDIPMSMQTVHKKQRSYDVISPIQLQRQLGALPPGWEQAKTNDGQIYYLK